MDMDIKNVYVDCKGFDFLKYKEYDNNDVISLRELLGLLEDMYFEIETLQEQIRDMEDDIEENCIRKKPEDEFGVSDSDFI